MTGTAFNLVEELWNTSGGDNRAMAMVVVLGWQLGFNFKVKLAWGCMGRYTRAYIGVWEECGRTKVRIRVKIRVYLKNEILQNQEIRVGFG
jgi:hypothetical protein